MFSRWISTPNPEFVYKEVSSRFRQNHRRNRLLCTIGTSCSAVFGVWALVLTRYQGAVVACEHPVSALLTTAAMLICLSSLLTVCFHSYSNKALSRYLFMGVSGEMTSYSTLSFDGSSGYGEADDEDGGAAYTASAIDSASNGMYADIDQDEEFVRGPWGGKAAAASSSSSSSSASSSSSSSSSSRSAAFGSGFAPGESPFDVDIPMAVVQGHRGGSGFGSSILGGGSGVIDYSVNSSASPASSASASNDESSLFDDQDGVDDDNGSHDASNILVNPLVDRLLESLCSSGYLALTILIADACLITAAYYMYDKSSNCRAAQPSFTKHFTAFIIGYVVQLVLHVVQLSAVVAEGVWLWRVYGVERVRARHAAMRARIKTAGAG